VLDYFGYTEGEDNYYYEGDIGFDYCEDLNFGFDFERGGVCFDGCGLKNSYMNVDFEREGLTDYWFELKRSEIVEDERVAVLVHWW